MSRQRYIFAKDKKSRFESTKYIPWAILVGALGGGYWLSLYFSSWSNLKVPLGKAIEPEGKPALAPIEAGLAPQIVKWQQAAGDILFTEVVPLKFQQKALKEVTLSQKTKAIALTFDDGPWPGSTQQILDILRKEQIKATFFVLGQPLQSYPKIARQVVAEGHSIGNHSWHHWYQKLDATTSAKEIETTSALIYKTTGVKTHLFRPPGGLLNNGVADYAKKKKYFVALWSADSRDYHRPSATVLAKNVMKDARPGGMVLMHDGGGDRSQTVRALPQIIAQLKKQGYSFVTVPQLLEIADRESRSLSSQPKTSQ